MILYLNYLRIWRVDLWTYLNLFQIISSISNSICWHSVVCTKYLLTWIFTFHLALETCMFSCISLKWDFNWSTHCAKQSEHKIFWQCWQTLPSCRLGQFSHRMAICKFSTSSYIKLQVNYFNYGLAEGNQIPIPFTFLSKNICLSNMKHCTKI